MSFKVEDAECLRESDSGKAILVDAPVFDQPEWIPKSQVCDYSEVYTPGTDGELVITDFFADKKGWLD